MRLSRMEQGLMLGVVLFASAYASGCSKSEDTTGSGGAGGVAWSSSTTVSSASAAGQGGASASTSVSGPSSAQGTAASVASSSGATTSVVAASSSGSGGGGPAGHAVLLAGGAQKLVGAHFDGSAWTTAAIAGATDRQLAVGYLKGGIALGVHRDPAKGALEYESFDGAKWSAPAAVGPTVTTQGAPAFVASGGVADVVFHGDDFKHYFASYGSAWNPVADAVKPSASEQSFGPVPGAIARPLGELVFAFPGGNGGLFVQSRQAAAWQVASQLPNTTTSLTPAVVELTSGAELLLVYVSATDKKLMFMTRTAGKWSASAVVESNSFSGDPPALTALPNGEALLAFRGFDMKPYTSRFVPGATPPWSQPKPLAAANPTVTSTPSVAMGIGGHDAEVAFVGTDGKAYHASLVGAAWSAPLEVAGPGLLHVALATAP